MIQRCGLEDCAALIGVVTPAQLSAVFDLDLWNSPLPGGEELFDTDRFGIWLDVLLESGADVAASTLAALDVNVVTTAFAQFVRVYDPATLLKTMDGEMIEAELTAELTCDIGGYRIAAQRADSWDAITAILAALDATQRRSFLLIMQGCRALSNEGKESDGLDHLLSDADQVMFDRSVERERRREQQGYITPAEARAFLQMARTLSLGSGTAPPSMNAVAAAYLAAQRSARENSAADAQVSPGGSHAADAVLMEALIDGGVLPHQPKGLLGEAQDDPTRCALMQQHMTVVAERDVAAYAARQGELIFLANTLVAGCAVQQRAFTPREASDAAVAICNLGLDLWPAHWQLSASGTASPASDQTMRPDDFLIEQDLVAVFQVGWTTLHAQACLLTARELIAVLQQQRCDDPHLRSALRALRRELRTQCQAGTPWQASDALDVMTSFDMAAWATLVGLIAECPTAHAALTAAKLRSISPTDFEFFSERRQIASVREFMTTLADRLAS